MGHNELCLLTGIRPFGGPSHLLLQSDIEVVVKEMVDEIKSISKPTPSDLASILQSSLSLAAIDDDETWKPSGLGDWPYFDICIAIGYFDRFGSCDALYWSPQGKPRAPGGRNVEVRRVYTDQKVVWFNYVVVGEPGTKRKRKLGGAYRYLEAWLNRDILSPRSTAFPTDPEPMSMASEFYEIVNSRTQPREVKGDHTGILPCIDYGGIETTCKQYQDMFVDARRGSKYTAHAIGLGLRGKDLLPSLTRDFGGWMCMRPDIWPTPSSIPVAGYKRFEEATPQGLLHELPLEIILDIVAHVSVSDIARISTTCQFIRNFFMDADILNAILRDAVLSPTGSLRWLLPVQSVHGETERATSVAYEWLESPYALTEPSQSPISSHTPKYPSPFLHHAFPFHIYVPTCLFVDATLPSMSMSNRRRLWGIVQQYQLVWQEYRTKGWERGDIFSMFEPST